MTETNPLPVRTPRNRAMTAALQNWGCRDSGLIQRTLDGLRDDHPAACRAKDAITTCAHAYMVMSAHAAHRGCPRYTAAANYLVAAR